jgi:hypothetical protein
MIRLTSVLLAVALCVPALASADETTYDFIAVVDGLALDANMAEAVRLDSYDGPVVLASAASAGNYDSWVRYDANLTHPGPLADFPVLGLLADEWSRDLPVVITDRMTAEEIVASVNGELPAEGLRAVVETAFLAPEVLEALPSNVAQADVIVSVDLDAAEKAELPTIDTDYEKVLILDPADVDAAAWDAVLPATDENSSMGLLCGNEWNEALSCVIAETTDGNPWVLWTAGRVEQPEPPKVEEEVEVEDTGAGSGAGAGEEVGAGSGSGSGKDKGEEAGAGAGADAGAGAGAGAGADVPVHDSPKTKAAMSAYEVGVS